jgi:DNA-3-methyladenine glycosylase
MGEGAPILPPDFFERSAGEVARALLGQLLVSRVGGRTTGGRIIETEAYLGVDDPASHAFGGRRHRGNDSIYGRPGNWYVYRSYGIHWCMNLVTGPPGVGAAALLRGIRPSLGMDVMGRRRRGVDPARLADGPGKLTQALGVDVRLDGMTMRESAVVVRHAEPVPDALVRITPRVGITRAADWPLRFLLKGS